MHLPRQAGCSCAHMVCRPVSEVLQKLAALNQGGAPTGAAQEDIDELHDRADELLDRIAALETALRTALGGKAEAGVVKKHGKVLAELWAAVRALQGDESGARSLPAAGPVINYTACACCLCDSCAMNAMSCLHRLVTARQSKGDHHATLSHCFSLLHLTSLRMRCTPPVPARASCSFDAPHAMVSLQWCDRLTTNSPGWRRAVHRSC